MLQTQKRPVQIYMEANPNPNSLKFVLNFMLVDDGVSFDFPHAESASNAPLAQELFNFAAVERVFIAANFVTVTKKEEVDWLDIQDLIRDHIKSFFEAGKQPINKVFDKDPLFDENDRDRKSV